MFVKGDLEYKINKVDRRGREETEEGEKGKQKRVVDV